MPTSPPRALITGATGFIGRHLALRLTAQGWSVKLLVRHLNKLDPRLANTCTIIQGDLENIRALERAVQSVDYVFHCAANVNTWDRWEAYYKTNVYAVRRLLYTIQRVNPNLLRYVHVSTVDVYGYSGTPCDERSFRNGAGFGYGESKRLGEDIVTEFCSHAGIAYTLVRPTNVIGPGSQFIQRIGDALRNGVMLQIDHGHVHAGLLYIDTLLDYLIWAAQADGANGQSYNVRDHYDADWAIFINRFRRAIQGHGLVINLPYSWAVIAARILETLQSWLTPQQEPLLHRLLICIFGRTCGHPSEKIVADSGIKSHVDFDAAMDHSIRWYLNQTELNKSTHV